MSVTSLERRQRSLTSTARRTQIVGATVEVIAAEGFGQASFARIASQAGLSSTRLISYHFAGKDDLIAAVVDDVVGAIGTAVGRRVRAASTAAGMLHAYIEGVTEFTATHRPAMRALLQIVRSGALPGGGGDVAVGHVEAILRRGQAEGEFRDFDPQVMAIAVQRAVEALPFALESDPDLDCAAYASELVTLFRLATRRSEAR